MARSSTLPFTIKIIKSPTLQSMLFGFPQFPYPLPSTVHLVRPPPYPKTLKNFIMFIPPFLNQISDFLTFLFPPELSKN